MALGTFALSILVPATSAQAAMTGPEIKTAVSGKTLAYQKGSSRGTVTYGSGGSLRINWNSKGKSGTKSGSWWISGNKVCAKYARGKSKNKSTECNSWTSLGGGKFKSSSGATLNH